MSTASAALQHWKVPGSSRSRIIVIALVVVAVIAGVIQGRPDHSPSSVSSSSSSAIATDSPSASSGEMAKAQPAVPTVEDGPQIVRTGIVVLAVPASKVSSTLASVLLVATKFQGEVAQSSTDESAKSPSGTVTLRVPAARTDDAIRELRSLGTVVSVNTSSEDVTGQVVDISAHLRSATASRERYLELLAKAGTIAETLQVQQRIDTVQTDIEQLSAQSTSLANRTQQSTLVVNVASRGGEPQQAKTGLAKAWSDAGTRFGDGVEAVVAASGTAAFLLVLAAGLGMVLLVARVLLRRRTAD